MRIRILLSTLLTLTAPLIAQQPPTAALAAQHKAMQKLSFLAGHWSGPVSVTRGPGEPVHLTQTENVQYKLDGLVLLIEGQSKGADGKVSFSALATVSFDDTSHVYHFRAYNEGHYLDTELTVLEKGFSWSFTSGPAHITNTMHLTDSGQWAETTDVAIGSNPASHSVAMLLTRQP